MIYQDNTKITINKQQYLLFVDRVILDKTHKLDNEFVFAELKLKNTVLYFVAPNNLNKSFKNIGFWHTLFLNNSIDFSDAFFYSIVNELGDGQYLLFEKPTITTGVIIGNALPNMTTNTKKHNIGDVEGGLGLGKAQEVLTPKQQAIKQKNKQNKTKVIIIIFLILAYFSGQYINNLYLKKEKEAIQKLALSQGRANKNIVSTNKTNNTSVSRLNELLPILTYLSTQQPAWQGDIDFFKPKSVLFGNTRLVNKDDFKLKLKRAKDGTRWKIIL